MGWLSAVPSFVDGMDYKIAPALFAIDIKLLLRAPIHADGIPCPFCKLPMNKFGDHALSCRNSGDLISRHNRERNALYKIADHGSLSPVLEKKGILGDDVKVSGRRPGDVSTPCWAAGRGLAIDVAVISSVAQSHRDQECPLDEYALTKHKKYDADFVNCDYDFAAVIFSSGGGINSAGEEILKQMYRFAAKQTGERYSVYCAKAWTYLSVTLQRSIAQSVLNRSPSKIDSEDDVLCGRADAEKFINHVHIMN
jgi:hypothetical protein